MPNENPSNDNDNRTGTPPANGVGRGEILPGPDWPAEAAEFARRQAGTVRSEPVLAVHRDAAASWLQEKANGFRNDAGALVDEVIARALARPDQTTLLETHALLTELGRDPEISALITERLTGDVVQQIMQLSAAGRPEED
ncbi:hypothetical protein AB0M22_39340 [Nocardia sp. NPDC051756]|uniref:hypothetical protein n=1 Tax=Nocardia sp. NPDC051756 TaxID=3154751 RepID=UPI0034139C55